MKNRTQIHISPVIRRSNISDIESIKHFYQERVTTCSSNIEDEANSFASRYFNSRSLNRYIDCGDYADMADSIELEHYELLKVMQYRTRCLWISCVCQIWEQQFVGLIREYDNSINNFCDAQKKIDFDLVQILCYKKLDELRCLVNTIKHAEGNAATKLRKLRPDYFNINDKKGILGSKEIDTLRIFKNTLLDATLNVTDNDMETYIQAIVEFWERIPQYIRIKTANE